MTGRRDRRRPASAGPTREVARRRLRSLAGWELLNVPLQGWLWFQVVGVPPTAANLAGFGAVAALLVVGAAYWTVKLRQLRRGEPRLPGRRHFATARVALPVLLAAVFAACTVAAVRTPGAQSFPGLAFAVFAALEYVNYFHVQLMHDNPADLRRLARVGLRRSHLARDLRVTR